MINHNVISIGFYTISLHAELLFQEPELQCLSFTIILHVKTESGSGMSFHLPVLSLCFCKLLNTHPIYLFKKINPDLFQFINEVLMDNKNL